MPNRFENGSLNKGYGKQLLKFSYNGEEFSVRATEHSLQRFKDYNLDVDAALGSIIALGEERLYKFSNDSVDVAIIDKENNISVIITFESEDKETQIRIRTIIPRSHIFVKTGTRVYKLEDYKGGF